RTLHRHDDERERRDAGDEGWHEQSGLDTSHESHGEPPSVIRGHGDDLVTIHQRAGSSVYARTTADEAGAEGPGRGRWRSRGSASLSNGRNAADCGSGTGAVKEIMRVHLSATVSGWPLRIGPVEKEPVAEG